MYEFIISYTNSDIDSYCLIVLFYIYFFIVSQSRTSTEKEWIIKIFWNAK